METFAIVLTPYNVGMIVDQLTDGYTKEDLLEEYEQLTTDQPPVLFMDDLGDFRCVGAILHHTVVTARDIKFEGELNKETFVKVPKRRP